jgi:uncharacterized peroxidase-related enzyme
MAYIEEIKPSEAEGELQQTDRLIEEKRGEVEDIFKIHSLKPDVMKTDLGMYLSIPFDAHGLSRRERETVAVAVSQENACGYCVEHHSEALFRYENDQQFISGLRSGNSRFRNARVNEMIRFARKLTCQRHGTWGIFRRNKGISLLIQHLQCSAA